MLSDVYISDLVRDIKSKKLSAHQLVTDALKKLQDSSEYNTVISTNAEEALKKASEIDSMDLSHNNQLLLGIPYIAKDNFLIKGTFTTAASNMLRNFMAPYQSTAINKLEEQGAICIAKANLDAFAHGSSTENSDFMITKNPYDKTRVPGGSSGGSAAAVALDIVPFSVGTDTGGSIRQPASFSGVIGYKPTYGLVSRSGVVAMASSTDCVGVLARNSKNTALVMEIISGNDPLDSTTLDSKYKISRSAISGLNKKPKIGVITEYMDNNLNSDIKNKINDSVHKLQRNGATVSQVSLPSLALSLAVYYIICPAEVSSNLSRYDGIRYGHSAKNSKNLEEHYINSRTSGFGEEAKRRIMIGTYVLSSGYYDAYYKKAQTVRTKIIDEFNKAFKEFDFLVGPTVPTIAFKVGEHTSDPLSMYLSDIMTVASNLAGIPSVSMPCGKIDGMPLGLQIMADQKQDNKLLSFMETFEKVIV